MAIQSMFVASHSSLLTSRLVSLLASRLSLLLIDQQECGFGCGCGCDWWRWRVIAGKRINYVAETAYLDGRTGMPLSVNAAKHGVIFQSRMQFNPVRIIA